MPLLARWFGTSRHRVTQVQSWDWQANSSDESEPRPTAGRDCLANMFMVENFETQVLLPTPLQQEDNLGTLPDPARDWPELRRFFSTRPRLHPSCFLPARFHWRHPAGGHLASTHKGESVGSVTCITLCNNQVLIQEATLPPMCLLMPLACLIDCLSVGLHPVPAFSVAALRLMGVRQEVLETHPSLDVSDSVSSTCLDLLRVSEVVSVILPGLPIFAVALRPGHSCRRILTGTFILDLALKADAKRTLLLGRPLTNRGTRDVWRCC